MEWNQSFAADVADRLTRAPETLGSTASKRLKLKFAPDHSMPAPAGVEYLTEEEEVLDLFADNEGDFSPIPTESFESKVWEDEEDDQQVRSASFGQSRLGTQQAP